MARSIFFYLLSQHRVLFVTFLSAGAVDFDRWSYKRASRAFFPGVDGGDGDNCSTYCNAANSEFLFTEMGTLKFYD